MMGHGVEDQKGGTEVGPSEASLLEYTIPSPELPLGESN